MYKLWITFAAVDNLWIKEKPYNHYSYRVFQLVLSASNSRATRSACSWTHNARALTTCWIWSRIHAELRWSKTQTSTQYTGISQAASPWSGHCVYTSALQFTQIHGATGRNRTGTPLQREILSLLCLPISPQSLNFGAISVSRTQHQRIMSPLL